MAKLELILVSHRRYEEGTFAFDLFTSFKKIAVLSRRFKLSENDIESLDVNIKKFTLLLKDLTTKKKVTEEDANTKTKVTRFKMVDFRFTPKIHFLQHYVEMAREFGLLSITDSLIYERDHQSFKNLLRLNKNYLNLPYTMMRRHSLKLAIDMEENRFIEEDYWKSKRFNIFDSPPGEIVQEKKVDIVHTIDDQQQERVVIRAIKRCVIKIDNEEEVFLYGEVCKTDDKTFKGLPILNPIQFGYINEFFIFPQEEYIYSFQGKLYLVEGI